MTGRTHPEADRGKGPTDAIRALAEVRKSGLGVMMGMSEAMTEAIGNMGAEFAGFLAGRIKEDIRTQHRLLHCKDLGEIQRIQVEFFRKALDEYQAETGKLIEMGAQVFSTPKSDEALS